MLFTDRKLHEPSTVGSQDAGLSYPCTRISVPPCRRLSALHSLLTFPFAKEKLTSVARFLAFFDILRHFQRAERPSDVFNARYAAGSRERAEDRGILSLGDAIERVPFSLIEVSLRFMDGTSIRREIFIDGEDSLRGTD